MAERIDWQTLCGALGIILLGLPGLIAPASAAEDDEQPWYQVEVILFLNETGLSDTDERLLGDADPAYPAAVLELAPPWGEPVRPRTLAELLALWDSVGQRPRVDIVPAGLTPELLRLMRWLDVQLAGAHPIDLGVLDDLDRFAFQVATLWADAGDSADPDAMTPLPPLEPIVLPPLERKVFRPRRMVAETGELEVEIEIPVALALREVPTDERLLRSEMRRLSRAQGYRVLGWLAWRQPFERDAPALPVMVQWVSADGSQRLDGGIGVDLRRFLHAAIELYWQTPGTVDPVAIDQSAMGPGAMDPGTLDRGAPMAAPPPEVIHVSASRRMRSGETHYVDHPRIGAIIRAEPFELEAPLEPPP